MKRILNINLILFFLLICNLCKGQNQNDSIIYWINQQYYNCIFSGNSICDCTDQIEYIILYVDTSDNSLKVQCSKCFDGVIFQYSIKSTHQDMYIINRIDATNYSDMYDLDTCNFSIKDNILTLVKEDKKFLFQKLKVKRPDEGINNDLYWQVHLLSCKPLLDYDIEACSDTSKLYFTHDELLSYIQQGLPIIECSPDYNYNEMIFEDSRKMYFMDYGKDSIRIYQEPYRSLLSKIDFSKLKTCEMFYKKKK